MEIPMTAIEMMGTIDEKSQLVLDGLLPIIGPKRVRVIVLSPLENEISEKEWLKAASANPAFNFLNDPAENIYSVNDGKPFDGEK